MALTLAGQMVPKAVHEIVMNGLDTIKFAHDPSGLGLASLVTNILDAFDIEGMAGKAVDAAGIGVQIAQIAKTGNVAAAINLSADLHMRAFGASDDFRATFDFTITLGRLAAGDLTALAQLPWSIMGLAQAHSNPRTGLGEHTIGDGLVATVQHKHKDNGPKYEYVVSGDQPNLPEMVSASFSLLEQPDGSFIVSGFGKRAPIDGMNGLGTITPNWVALRHMDPDERPSFKVSAEVGQRWLAMQGGKADFNVDRSFPDFAIIEGLFDAAKLDTTWERNAKNGLLATVNTGMGPFNLIHYPSGLDETPSHNKVQADYKIPGMTHLFEFRDAESAALFQAYGLNILSAVAADPELIAAFDPRHDIQGMIDFMLANPDRLSPADPFNAFAYAAANPDLREHLDERDMMGYALHYLTAGHAEGRPRHADLAATTAELERYLAFASFDEDVYLALYPDVAAAVAAGQVADGREHFRLHGLAEGRMSNFNGEAYLAANPGLAEALAETGVTALQHYVLHGRAEGRPLAPPAPEIPEGYDEALYLQQNPDVAAAVEAGQIASGLEHFHLFGEAEGRSPGIVPEAPTLPEGFDAAVYMNQNPDILEAGIASGRPLDEYAIDHYLAFGKDEGRAYA
jgi:hypothetical protein